MFCDLGRIMRDSFTRTATRINDDVKSAKGVLGFAKNEHGNMTMVFGFSMMCAVSFVGMTVDFGRGFATKAAIDTALDQASLAGGRKFDETGSTSEAANMARMYFYKVLPQNIKAKLTSVKVDLKGSISMAASTNIKTMFLGVVGYATLPITASVAAIAQDSGGKDLELAIVMDVTGSMQYNQKLETAKTAANLLINTLLPAGGTGARSVRISIVPFSEFVNVGSYASAATGVASSTTSSYTTNNGCNWGETETSSIPICTRYRNNGSCRNWGTQSTCSVTNYLNNCMAERLTSTGAAYSDAAPSTTPFHAFTTTSSSATNCSAPAASVTPLTSTKATLLSAVSALAPAGGTAGHIGTAWGWYTLSPNWAGFWPAGSVPAAPNPDKLMKAVIIMTDGAYNTHYDNNYASVYEDNSWNPNAGNGTAGDQALAICNNMKAAGVEVFSVGVELGNDIVSKTRLQNCVSSANNMFSVHYYDVVSAMSSQTGLVSAFNDIANRLNHATGTGQRNTILSQ